VIFNRAHFPLAGDPPAEIEAGAAAWIRRQNAAWNQAFAAESGIIDRVRNAWEGLDAVAVVPLLPEGATRIASLDRLGRYL